MDYVGAFADDASLRQEFLDLLKVWLLLSVSGRFFMIKKVPLDNLL
jgi:hypothetical protein